MGRSIPARSPQREQERSGGSRLGTANHPTGWLGVGFRTRVTPQETLSSASHLRPRPPAARLSWRSQSLPPRRCAPSHAALAGTRPPPARFSGGEAAGEAAAGGTSSAMLTSVSPPPTLKAPVPRYLPSRRQGPVHIEEAQHPTPCRRCRHPRHRPGLCEREAGLCRGGDGGRAALPEQRLHGRGMAGRHGHGGPLRPPIICTPMPPKAPPTMP